MSIESVILSNHLILCCPLLLLPSIFPSIKVFSIESVLHIRWPKYWSLVFSISLLMNIHDWFLLGLTGLWLTLSRCQETRDIWIYIKVRFLHLFLLSLDRKTNCYLNYWEKPIEQASVQFSSVTHLCPTLCDPMNHSTPGLPVHHQLLEFTQIHVHRGGDAIQPSHPLLSPSPPAPNPSQHEGLSQWVNSSHEVARVLEFQLQHQSFQWTPRTSFRMDWLDLFAVQGTLKSLLQYHSSKASILRRSAFFIVQL